MNKKTREALEASIKHWMKNVAAKTPHEVSIGALSCPLCLLFNVSDDAKVNCAGCPVAERVKDPYCASTPYMRAHITHANWACDADSTKRKKAFREAAQAELDFLISLRPAENERVVIIFDEASVIPDIMWETPPTSSGILQKDWIVFETKCDKAEKGEA